MKKILFVFAPLLVLSCTKETAPPPVTTADFAVNKTTVYILDSVKVNAADTSGNLAYTYDFGDGNTTTGRNAITHFYERGGWYTITLNIDGKTAFRQVRVLPGILSYQIKNLSGRRLDVLSYIDNFEAGNLYRKEYNPGTMSDTLYSSYAPSFSPDAIHLFGASVFINNTEYALKDITWIKEKKHSIMAITDSTKVVPRFGFTVNPNFYYIKDL